VIGKKLNKKSRKEFLLTTTCGTVLDYRGMTIDDTKRYGAFSKYDHINKMLSQLHADICGVYKASPVAHLFNVNDQANSLPKSKAQINHYLLAYYCTYSNTHNKTYQLQ